VLITNHVIAGALVGAVSPGPVSAFLLGVGSHFAMDALPHWGDDDVFLQVAVVDGLVGLTTMGLIWRKASAARRTTVAAGMLGAAFPDADKPWNLFIGGSPFPASVDRFHERIQIESPRRLPQEFVVAGLGVLTLGILRRRRGHA
jgi:hypothetical protein